VVNVFKFKGEMEGVKRGDDVVDADFFDADFVIEINGVLD